MKILQLVDNPLGRRSAAFRTLLHPAPNTSGWLMSAATWAEVSRRRRRLARREPNEYQANPERWESAKERLMHSWASNSAEPLPDEVRDEVFLRLYCSPGLRLEYMGRGPFFNKDLVPDDRGKLLILDIPGGRRHYCFRTIESSDSDRLQRVGTTLDNLTQWINEPSDARVVVSIGGGGLRFFAATAALTTIDTMLGRRDGVSEVWGASGGAFLGYCFANGMAIPDIDQFGYDLYNRRDGLVDGSVRKLAVAKLKQLGQQLHGITPRPLMQQWMEYLEQRWPSAQRPHPTLPFYSLAASVGDGRIMALADERHIAEHCRDILLPCNPWDAVAASTAVPMLLRAQQGLAGGAGSWVDGSLTDENPLVLPYIKWLRDRRYDPSTPERLKIVLINLNVRASESPILQTARGRVPGLSQMLDVVDTVLDSRTSASLQILKEAPGVEVLTCKLCLGFFAVNGAQAIPSLIRSGRQLEAWKFEIHQFSD